MKGDDLRALSDDPNEMQTELEAIAGADAETGAQLYVDGFSGGQLPPKSAIREIRINQNPYSAQYDSLGFGRIEIFTKPGADKLHGDYWMQGNDSPVERAQSFRALPAALSLLHVRWRPEWPSHQKRLHLRRHSSAGRGQRRHHQRRHS